MKLSLLFFAYFIFAQGVCGQNFYPKDGHFSQKQVAFKEANLCFIYFENNSGDTLHLKWRRIEASKPAEWDVDICDYGTCYVNVPPQGTMNPLPDTALAYLKLIVRPGEHPGTAWYRFRVAEVGNENNFHDVYFSVYTEGIVATQLPENQPVSIFPNPADGFVFLKNLDLPEGSPVRIFDVFGKLIAEIPIGSPETERIETAGLPAGTYFVSAGKTRKILSIIH